jgi:leucyl-tRNA synthetase
MIDLKKVAEKWQFKWEKERIFEAKENNKKKKMYVLEMFPYPSGGGLHMGHVRNYSIGDCLARYKRMQGFNVLYPMGYDSFGLPAENAAIQKKAGPNEWTLNNIKLMKSQQKKLGFSYDWSKEVATMQPDYYKWNQWIFLKFYEKDLAYKKKAIVNWCPGCNTVLANEQVEQGKCWRCSSNVENKELEQWFFKITAYADQLLEDLKKLENWPERVKIMQENWIGKSEGLEEYWEVDGMSMKLATFTTWPHTTWGATFMVIAPEHPLIEKLVKGTKYEKGAKAFIEKVKHQKIEDRANPEKEKEGFFIGRYVINHITGWKMPLYIANFAIMEYGTGIVKCCPTHDQRDFEFAKKYRLPLKLVIKPTNKELKAEDMKEAFVEEGVMVNAGQFNGMSSEKASKAVADYIVMQGNGKYITNYKLRDWLISRQRYWGTPIPIVYCTKCGIVPVPYEQLPVLLPQNVKFTGSGNPLATAADFVNTKCPKCGGKAKRETDTMDTFVDSSWYFFRYCSPHYEKLPFDKEKVRYWMPVDQYIGGIEHAVMHLLYARFFTKALRDLGLLGIDEPFTRLLCQGMVTKDGAKMSKSLGNIVDPSEIINKYGPDTARLFILFASLPEKDMEWSDQGVTGAFRFLNRVYALVEKGKQSISLKKASGKLTTPDKLLMSKMHRTIKKVTDHLEKFEYSLAIGSLMGYVNALQRYKEKNSKVLGEAIKTLALLICPFTPHVAEEVWERLGCKGFVSTQSWPMFNEKMIDEEAEASERIVDSTRADIIEVLKLTKIRHPKKINLFISAEWKYDLFKKIKKILEKTRDQKEIINFVIDKKHAAEIPRIVQKVTKTGMPEVIIDQKKELVALNTAKKGLEEEFKTKIEVIRAEESAEPKSKQSLPGKPAILVEK